MNQTQAKAKARSLAAVLMDSVLKHLTSGRLSPLVEKLLGADRGKEDRDRSIKAVAELTEWLAMRGGFTWDRWQRYTALYTGLGDEARSRLCAISHALEELARALGKIERLRGERDRLRREVVALRGDQPCQWTLDEASVGTRAERATFTCSVCGRTTAAPVDAYFDPCPGERAQDGGEP